MSDKAIAAARVWLRDLQNSIREDWGATYARASYLFELDQDTSAERQRLWDEYAARVRPLQDEHDRIVRLLADLPSRPPAVVIEIERGRA